MAIVFPFKPNWKNSVTKTLTYKTEILLTRDRTEQRLAARSQPRTVFEFTANPSRDDVAKLSALFFKDIQGEFVLPEFPSYVRATADRIAGFDSIVVADPAPYWAAAGFWLVVETSKGLEAFLVASVAAGVISLTGTLAGDVLAGAKVYPGILGRLDQNSKATLLTSRVSGWPVTFNADPSPRNYPAQIKPLVDSAANGLPRHVDSPISGGITYYTLAQLGLTPEMVDTGRVSISQVVFAKFKDENNNDMGGYVAASIRFYADNGSGAHASTALPGGTFTASATVTGSTTQTVRTKIMPGTRHVGFDPDVLSTIPFYTLATYSVVNTILWTPENDAIQSYYNEAPIFPMKPNWSNAVSLIAIGALEDVDYDNGPVENYSYLTWNAVSTQATYLRRDAAEIERLVSLFNLVHGQQGEVYFPSWIDDFDLSIGAAQGATTLTTPGYTMFQSYAGSEFHRTAIVFWRDGTFQINAVASIAGAGLNSLTTFYDPWVNDLNPSTALLMCWFNRCRLMIDTLNLEYLTDNKVTTQLTYKIVKEPT